MGPNFCESRMVQMWVEPLETHKIHRVNANQELLVGRCFAFGTPCSMGEHGGIVLRHSSWLWTVVIDWAP